MGLLNHVVVLFLFFCGTSILFPRAAVPFYNPSNIVQAFQCLHILANTCYFLFVCLCFLFHIGHPNGCEMISHSGFDLLSLMISDVEHLFVCLLTICISSLKKHLFKSFPHFKGSFVFLFVCLFFDDGHSDPCEMISHCSFDLHFSNLHIFFGEMSI